jgi:hypothetical protein
MENESIVITDDASTEEKQQEQKTEAAPGWASEMANTMRALADKVTAVPETVRPGLTPDQIKDINEKLTKGIVEGNPLGALAPIADQISKENIEHFRKGISPYVNEAVENFVDRFRSRMKEDAEDNGQVALYKQVNKQFEKELEGENLTSLIEKPRAERDKMLGRIWNAAKGEVLGKRVQSTQEKRPPGSRGSEGGSTGGGSTKNTYKLAENEKRQLYRSMPKEVADRYILELESQLSNVQVAE